MDNYSIQSELDKEKGGINRSELERIGRMYSRMYKRNAALCDEGRRQRVKKGHSNLLSAGL